MSLPVLLLVIGTRLLPRRLQGAKKRAGVDCTMYDLRHTYASWLVQTGVGIYTVKDLLGHGDIDSTMRYAHLDYAHLVSAVDLIN